MKKAVLISCFDWYNQRLKFIKRELENNGYEVVILTSDFSHIKKERIINQKKEQIYINTISYKKNISFDRLYSHYNFSKKIVEYVKKIKPNLVYTLIPPNSLVKDIAKLKYKLNFYLIFDVIDLWPESLPINKSIKKLLKPWQIIRNKYINNADLIVLECNHYKKEFINIIPENKMETLYIIKESTINYLNYKTEKYEEDYINLAYLGSINDLIDIEKIVSITKKLQLIKNVKIKIIGKGSREKEFINSLAKAGAKVEFYGPIFDDDEKMKIFSNCHFGLNIYKDSVEIGLTLKSVDYFFLGLPILNTIKGDTQELINNNKDLGLNLNDGLDLNLIMEFLNDIETKKQSVRNVYVKNFDSNNISNILHFLPK